MLHRYQRIDTGGGFYDTDIEESMVKSEAINRSYMTFMLADHSKFGIVAPVTIAPLSSGCIITDRIDDVRYKDYYSCESSRRGGRK